MERTPRIARRMAEIAPFHVMDLLARAQALEAAGRDIVHMEVGEPDFPTPEPVVRAGQQALAAGHTHYTPAAGLPQLREAISGYYADRHGVNVPPERIILTPGASGALQLIMGVVVDPGNRVLLPDPGYPCNPNFVRLVEGEGIPVPVDATSDYQLTPQHLASHWDERTVAAMVGSPSNPTGTLATGEDLRALAGATAQRGGRLIVDEIYQGLVYEGEAPTALGETDEAFVVNSFSKFFGMTGWRLGWVVAPEAYVRELDKLAGNIFLAPPTPAQHAALAAFGDDTRAILEQRRQAFQQRRDFLLPALRELGFRIPGTPRGAFYLYADAGAFSDDSFAFAERVLEGAGVALTPGIDFGRHRAGAHVRFAYTTNLDRLEEGVARLARYLRP
ncbi:pyridoxal phosphate-dependent aminotransferase [Thiohalorhabdus sp.]|uniref:pyridoxal phosphate-dependent aminotransferase n=1 Tax=Thiohalorhabdus sp. TaxID=3094134 RepID=UPI003FCD8900